MIFSGGGPLGTLPVADIVAIQGTWVWVLGRAGVTPEGAARIQYNQDKACDGGRKRVHNGTDPSALPSSDKHFHDSLCSRLG